jgi:hypothetical protein
VTEVAAEVGGRQTLHEWLRRYGQGGLEGLVDVSRRAAAVPASDGSAVSDTTPGSRPSGRVPLRTWCLYAGGGNWDKIIMGAGLPSATATTRGRIQPARLRYQPSSTATREPRANGSSISVRCIS